MSEKPDESEKTEEPTQRKLEEAYKKGDFPKSQEVNTWFSLLALAMLVMMFSGNMLSGLAVPLKGLLSHIHDIPVTGIDMVHMVVDLAGRMAVVLLIPFGLLLVAALAGNLIQHKPVLSGEKMKPKLEKISPLAGAKRLFSPSSLVNFAKGVAKLTIVTVIMFMVVWPERDRFADLVTMDLTDMLPETKWLATKLIIGALAFVSIVAGLDFIYQRFSWLKKQRMTTKEIKDEYKQTEGDPTVKAKLRQIRAERGRQRMMAAVPDATVVITNPTHYAVALKYEKGMQAPVCVAKGTDAVALRIRALAEENSVPVVENPPLARALHASIEIEETVPTEHYKAVAEVIGYVLQLGSRGQR